MNEFLESRDELVNDAVQKIKQDKSYLGRIIFSIIGFIVILAFALGAAWGLAKLKKEPTKVVLAERPLRVETMAIQSEDISISMTGQGDVRSLNVVSIAPEVGGRIVEIHPRLELGEVIPEGETLFKIDGRDYQARVADAEATVAQLENSVERLNKQYTIDRDRLITLERSRDLAKAEFDRVKALLEKDRVGTQSGVDQAERAYNTVMDQTRQLAQAVELYPIRIQESKSSLASVKAKLSLAQTSLERTEVKAPFNARIKSVNLEENQYVMPGSPVITLADDSILEISVALDTRQARKWLRFNTDDSMEGVAWFNSLVQVPCEVYWSEDTDGFAWKGILHRVMNFEQSNRTITVAIRIKAEDVESRECTIPLVEGMYCRVVIPGQSLFGGYRLPSSAVTFDNTVYISENDRLKTQPVVVAHIEGPESFISDGLNEGDKIVVTRLVNPLENSLLEEVRRQESEEIE